MAVINRGHVWRVQLTMGRDPRTGKRKRLSYTFDTEAEARAFERRKKAELERLAEEHIRPSAIKLTEFLSGWLQRKERDGLAARTLFDYRYCIERLIVPTLGNESLADLSPTKVQRWQDALAPTRTSRGATIAAKAFRVLRSALSDAERMGMIARNPGKAARPAQRTPNKRPGFTLQEAFALLDAAEGERLAPLFSFVLHSGLRVTEGLGLRWSDVDLERGLLSVRQDMVYVGGRMVAGQPKTRHSARTFALLPQAIEDLQGQQGQQATERRRCAAGAWHDNGLVFAAQNGAPLNTANVDRAFQRVRERAGVRPLPLYSLRHATASILLAAGVPAELAAKMMGHSLTMFFETYADLLVAPTHEAAARAGAFLRAQGRRQRPPSRDQSLERE